MAEVVNLRQARKRAGRARAEAEAATNRLTHGASRSERDRVETDRRRAESHLDQHHLQSRSAETGDRT